MAVVTEQFADVQRRPWWREPTAVVVWLVVVAVLVAIVISRVQAERRHDVEVDTLYCTLSGVDLLDRGQNTGRLCVDLLYGD